MLTLEQITPKLNYVVVERTTGKALRWGQCAPEDFIPQARRVTEITVAPDGNWPSYVGAPLGVSKEELKGFPPFGWHYDFDTNSWSEDA